jgi:hypothetical protein
MNKKTTVASGLILICLFMLVRLALGQGSSARKVPFAKGNLTLSGGFSLSFAESELFSEEGKSSKSFRFDPAVNYFILPGLAVGVKALLNYSSRETVDQTTWGVGPEITYYIGGAKADSVLNKRLFPFLSAAALFVRSQGSYALAAAEGEFDASGPLFSLGTGIVYLLSPSSGLFLETAYEYSSFSMKNGDARDVSTFTISGGIIGFLF